MGRAVTATRGFFGGSSSSRSRDLMAGVSKSELDKKPFEQMIAGQGTQEELRKKQLSQTGRLEDQATGKAPSIAEAQMKASSDRSLAQQLAAAQTGRGGSAAARERQLSKGAGEARRDLSQQAGIAKLQERQQAEQSLAQQLQSQRATDIGLSQADRASLQAFEQMKVDQDLAMAGMQLSANKQGSAESGNWLKRSIGISDKNAKCKIKKEGVNRLAKALSDEDVKKSSKKESKRLKSDKHVKEGMNTDKVENTSVAEIVATIFSGGGAAGASTAGKEVGKTAAKEAAKTAAKEGAKTVAKEGVKTAAKEVAKKSLFTKAKDYAVGAAKEKISDIKSGKMAKDYAKREIKRSLQEDEKPKEVEDFSSYSDENTKKAKRKEQQRENEKVTKAPSLEGDLSKAGKMDGGDPEEKLGKVLKAFEDFEGGVQVDKKGMKQFEERRKKLRSTSDENSKKNKKTEMQNSDFEKRFKAIKSKNLKEAVEFKRRKAEKPMKEHFSKAKKAGLSDKRAKEIWNKRQAKKGVESAKARRSKGSDSKLKESAKDFGKQKFIQALTSESRRPSDNTGLDIAKESRARLRSRSDENCKENVQKEDFNPKSFLDALQAYSYEYKDKYKEDGKGGEGRYLSVMAQDLEKAGPVGESMVETTPEGHKQVNYGKGFGAILAAQAHLNQRLNELEKKKK